ncbi:MAG: hypothetical protein AVDCRST_MAG68-2935 [uncultured Gemmatimonadetes bacterium]|uniref:Tail specific protease domain-containing protein n=1 Tax=uncultured Gemmatimonadota bacterium TaxID=203437 RepID=A0A6J4LSD9_9BACT|nr:MAG: hypothetical protein AVDCRST_MAG68-2935 [uncultured Gemmatimonadota bacterium]
MRPSITFFRGLAVALLAGGGASPARAQADTAWSALFRMDLDSARAIIAADHPGVLDRQNPAFARTLATAYQEALRAVPRIDSYNAYAIALARFGNRFQDAHLNVGGNRPVMALRDAGIEAVFRGGAFLVEWADTRYGDRAASLRGATVRDCDGAAAERVFRERVLSWRGRPSVEADWHRFAPLLFHDYGPPTPPAPRSCRFATPGGVVALPLQWEPLDTARLAERRRRAAPPRTLSLEWMGDARTLWVSLPTFAVDDSAGVAAMRGVIDSLRAETGRGRDRRLLVFDLRGNDGGSSRWGDEIAEAVFGAEWARRRGSGSTTACTRNSVCRRTTWRRRGATRGSRSAGTARTARLPRSRVPSRTLWRRRSPGEAGCTARCGAVPGPPGRRPCRCRDASW